MYKVVPHCSATSLRYCPNTFTWAHLLVGPSPATLTLCHVAPPGHPRGLTWSCHTCPRGLARPYHTSVSPSRHASARVGLCGAVTWPCVPCRIHAGPAPCQPVIPPVKITHFLHFFKGIKIQNKIQKIIENSEINIFKNIISFLLKFSPLDHNSFIFNIMSSKNIN